MSSLFLLLPLAFLVFAAWLTLRVLQLFLGPLYAAQNSRAPMQLFVTDYYVLLGQIAVYTLVFGVGTSKYRNDTAIFLPLFIGILAIHWFIATRMLSKARVRRFVPRALGQVLLQYEVGVALYCGFTAIPSVLALFAFPGILYSLVSLAIFLGAWWIFGGISKWIVKQADPLPEEQNVLLPPVAPPPELPPSPQPPEITPPS